MSDSFAPKPLTDLLESADNYLKELYTQSQILVDEYWEQWRAENKRLSALRQNDALGDNSQYHTGRLAPRFHQRQDAGSGYIKWYDWKKTSLRKFNKHYGQVIKEPVRGYSWAAVKKHANPWEREYFEAFEPKFANYRLLINGVFKSKRDIERLIKKLNKQEN